MSLFGVTPQQPSLLGSNPATAGNKLFAGAAPPTGGSLFGTASSTSLFSTPSSSPSLFGSSGGTFLGAAASASSLLSTAASTNKTTSPFSAFGALGSSSSPSTLFANKSPASQSIFASTTATGSNLFGATSSLGGSGTSGPNLLSHTPSSSASSVYKPSSLFPSVQTSCVSSETAYYLNSVCRRLTQVHDAAIGTDLVFFTLSSTPPETVTKLGGAALGCSPAQLNALMEQEVIRQNDSALVTRFLKAKADNPDFDSVYIVPIVGFQGLRQRDQTLKASMELLNTQTEHLANITKQHKARIRTTNQQIQRIKENNKTLRSQLIHITKLLEDNAKATGQYEINPYVARENEMILKKIDSLFRIGDWENELNILQGLIGKLKSSCGEHQVTRSVEAFEEPAMYAINQVLQQHKKSIQSLSEHLNKLEPTVSSIEASLAR